MGVIRFVLASLVLGGHAALRVDNIGQMMAVQLFFVLSGVYMAAVYTTKYSRLEEGAALFYVNRALRLWPTYLAVIALTALAAATVGKSIPNDFKVFALFRATPGAGALAYLVPANLFIFGQDVLSVDEATHYLLPVRQGWSIATELLFYLAVPWVHGRRFGLRVAPVLALACFALKFQALEAYGWRASYFFPLGNAGYFLLGCFLYHAAELRPIARLRARTVPVARIVAPVLFVAMAFSFPANHFESQRYAQHFAFLAAFGALVVLSFSDENHRLDTYLGNLSYGVYLNHILVVVLVSAVIAVDDQPRFFFATFAASVLLGIAIERLLQRPIDRFRDRITRRRARGALREEGRVAAMSPSR